jgi:hypothetical protein
MTQKGIKRRSGADVQRSRFIRIDQAVYDYFVERRQLGESMQSAASRIVREKLPPEEVA